MKSELEKLFCSEEYTKGYADGYVVGVAHAPTRKKFPSFSGDRRGLANICRSCGWARAVHATDETCPFVEENLAKQWMSRFGSSFASSERRNIND